MPSDPLVIRTAERLRKLPFREGSRPQKGISDKFSVYMSPARAGSYAVTLQIGVPAEQINQPELPGMSDVNQVIDELLECLELFNDQRKGRLSEKISEPAYYYNFVGISRRLAPDGQEIKMVGLTRLKNGNETSLNITRSQEEIVVVRPPTTATERSLGTIPIIVEGRLKYADDIDKREIKLIPKEESKKPYKIIVPKGYMDDIVRPLWGSNVKVAGLREGRTRKIDMLVGHLTWTSPLRLGGNSRFSTSR